MKSFKIRYDNISMGGSVSFEFPRNWDDQTVLYLCMAWQINEQLTRRAGLNLADNPIPDATVNFLLLAIVHNHVTIEDGLQAHACRCVERGFGVGAQGQRDQRRGVGHSAQPD